MGFDRSIALSRLLELEKHKPALYLVNSEVGGLSDPSKMPWLSYGLPTWACPVGSLLRKVPGSVCEQCYAHQRGRYGFANVMTAQDRRLELMAADYSRWAGNMVYLLRNKVRKLDIDKRYFRWHDSGDLQGQDHFDAVCFVAEKVPGCKFWLPTKEYSLIGRDENLARVQSLPNLTVRLSHPKVGQQLDDPLPGLTTSSVSDGTTQLSGIQCRAYDSEASSCDQCRACWDSPSNIIYPLH